ncbi:hypothetical protein [Bacteroides sp.]|uniref:hypothetical protein n=1 Tax=Bacteroides sp. TaxID=29523 RepID=UPI0026162C7D|nr:hypothetical protein [Bacteroides sp.]MDD3038547.1 hypothetical protein [Bacteroides sp.]
MKLILFYFSLIILTVSCQLKQKDNLNEDVIDDTCIPDTAKATAIFWIDKAEKKMRQCIPSVLLKQKYSFTKMEKWI